MRKVFLLIVFSGIVSLLAVAQEPIRPILEVFENHRYYHIADTLSNKLIVFLHGGVQNPYFNQSYDQISLSYLIERNDNFLEQAADNGFDLILPITNDSLDWLNQPQEVFWVLKNYLQSIPKQYQEIYIGGFSDGGTGSYKIFYNNPEYFDGLVVFNGYPQHANFYKDVDYAAIDSKKVIFFSTIKDKTIPYEFLMTEYCAQKEENANTYFYLANGNHSFQNYGPHDLQELFLILTNDVNNEKTDPIHGFVKNDELQTFYPFRKKIVRKYNFGKDIFEDNLIQLKKYKKLKK